MRIGMIFGQLRNGGGAYQLIHLARALMAMGHELKIITYYSPEPSFAKEWLSGLSIHACVPEYKPITRSDWQPIGLIRYLVELGQMTIRLSRLANRFNFDVLQPHEWPFQWAAVWSRLSGKKARIVWMCNDVWHITGHEDSPDKRILFRLTQRYLIAFLDKLITKQVDVITVLDHRIKRITKNFYRQNQIQVVRSGIDLTPYRTVVSRQSARQKLGLSQKEWIWLCLSIFLPHRCFEDVINALTLLKNQGKQLPKLYIVGSDEHAPLYADMLRKLIVSLSLETQVTLVNRYITQEEKKLYLAAANGFIFPNDHQTWGLVVIEAMASGLPCIVSSGAGVHEIIDQGKTGLIYKRRDVKDLAFQMKKMRTDAPLNKRLGEQGRLHVFKTYSWAAYAQQMEHFFRG